MIRKTISMPDEMGEWIENRIRSGQYNNDSEYFRDLVRHDQQRQEALARCAGCLTMPRPAGTVPCRFPTS